MYLLTEIKTCLKQMIQIHPLMKVKAKWSAGNWVNLEFFCQTTIPEFNNEHSSLASSFWAHFWTVLHPSVNALHM